MKSIALKSSPVSARFGEVLDWLRQMKAALALPTTPDPRRSADIAFMVDRGISRMRAIGIDPRI